jgi:hypothetical protein
MYQTIAEPIAVIGRYSARPGAVFQPVKFQWRQRTYLIEKITLLTEIKDGLTRSRMYSVLVKGTLYRLLFNRELQKWSLEEVWVE